MRREFLRLPEGFRQDVEAAALVLGAVFIAGALINGAGAPGQACWVGGGHFGPVGACLRWSLFGAVGAFASALIPAVPVLIALWTIGRMDPAQTTRWVAFLLGLVVLVSVAVALAHGGIAHPLQYDGGSGIVGNSLGALLVKSLGIIGAWLTLALAAFVLAASTVARELGRFITGPRRPRQRRTRVPVASSTQTNHPDVTDVLAALEAPPTDHLELPSLDLLLPAPAIAPDATRRPGDAVEFTLIGALRALNVEATVVGRKVGPSVARYDVEPAPSSPIRDRDALAKGLSAALHAPVRISALDRSGAIGVELPHLSPAPVSLRELIECPEYRQASRALPIVMGRDLEGCPVIADLARMPNLLVVGAAGSGKSVFLSSMIASLVYTHGAGTLRVLMADADEGELAAYNALPHLWGGVVTDYRKVASLLELALLSMRGRNELRVASGARNIQEFNQRALDGTLGPVPAGTWVDGHIYTGGPLPYLVVIIDDLLDLMRTGGPEIARSLSQLAEKARVVGIHLVGVTKHTDVDAVTPAFRAMFPGRVAFRVAHQANSRAIIGAAGAETLSGRGDMLFLPPGKSEPTRVQAPFTSREDTTRLMQWYGGEAASTEAVDAPVAAGLEPAACAPEPANSQPGKHLAA